MTISSTLTPRSRMRDERYDLHLSEGMTHADAAALAERDLEMIFA